MKKVFYAVALLLLGAQIAFAQLKTPQASPVSKISQEVGLTKVEIEYSRPSAKGRKVFGELVRFGEMWRTGANASTKVTFGEDAMVGPAGSKLTKGTYALYTIPNKDKWTVIFYTNTSYWGTPDEDYKEEEVAAKFDISTTSLNDNVETFTIAVANLRNNGADIEISWEKTKLVVPIKFDTDSKVMADIKAQMDGPSAGTFYASARYYYDEKKDLNTALEWVNKSLEKGGDKFWILRLKAMILADLGRYKDAISVAEASSALATKEGNKDYPAMNEKSIADWKKKM
jgi:tetratricopeptide (TPR) repeat protein